MTVNEHYKTVKYNNHSHSGSGRLLSHTTELKLGGPRRCTSPA